MCMQLCMQKETEKEDKVRYKQPFSVFPRKLKSGKVIYYYQTYDENGKRTATRSTGQITKTAAKHYLIQLYKSGLLVTPKNISLKDYSKNFWIWNKCPYIKAKIKRGGKISRHYAESQRRCLVLHVLPCLGDYKLSEITPILIEKWMFGMKDAGYKAISINHCKKALNVVFNYAVRENIIKYNPVSDVKPLIGESVKKSILTPDEIRKLFSIKWNNKQHYVLNMLAASTGMRMGEIQALQIQYVHEEFIEVVHSWDRKYGLKTTKTGKNRVIPIPSLVSTNIKQHIKNSNYNYLDDFVF